MQSFTALKQQVEDYSQKAVVLKARGAPETKITVTIEMPGRPSLTQTFAQLAESNEMLFTGDFLEAEDAYRLGLLNKLVPEDELEQVTMEMAAKIAAGPPIALRLSKLMLYKALEMDLETAMQMSAALETITLTSQDHTEGVAAFREKRKASYQGL
ncbi:MAG: hypothetical protein IH860_07910 [Chloroflexi bacterium]|nr:hypothetical protein [Chloroflexota bacterium]